MNALLIIMLGVLTTIHSAHSYVFVQARKGDNETNALIHKVIPSHKVVNFTDAFDKEMARKQFNNYKRFEVRKRAKDEDSKEAEGRNVDGVMIAINTGADPEGSASDEEKPAFMDKIEEMINEFAKNDKNPIYRSRDGYEVKPELVHFRSGKSSLKFELNSDSVIQAMQEFLSSPTVRRVADDVAKKASVVMKVIAQELKNDIN